MKPIAAVSPAAAKAAPAVKVAPASKAAPVVKASAPVVAVAAPTPLKPAPASIAPAKIDAPKPAVAAKVDIPAKAEAPAKPAAPLAIPGAQALPRALKGAADTPVAKARDAFSAARQSTEALAAGFGTSGEAAAKGLKSFQAALMEAVQANTDATLGYFRSLGEVKTLSDAIELQVHTARRQFEAFSTQAKTLAGIASRTAQEATAPVRKVLDSSLRPGS